MIGAMLLMFALALQGDALEVRAEPLEVEIGQPITITLELRHAAERRLELDPRTLLGDDSWVLLELGEALRSPKPGAEGFVRTRALLQVASLEPGARELVLGPLKLGEETLVVPALAIGVRVALAPGEDAPRPAQGLREVRDFAGQRSLLPPALALLALLLVGLGSILALRLRRRPPAAQTLPTPHERLEALAGTREPDAARAACYELTRILRAALDERLGRGLAGLTDEEWLAALPAEALGPEPRANLERLLARAERIKYGLEAPTRFALEEALGEGRSVLAGLAENGAKPAREVAA